MEHNRDYIILMTLVTKLYNFYYSKKSRRKLGSICHRKTPTDFVGVNIWTKFILIFQVWLILFTGSLYFCLILLAYDYEQVIFFMYKYYKLWILFHKRSYGMNILSCFFSWNTHPLIAVSERVIYIRLLLLSPNKMKFTDLLLFNRIHCLWLNKALKMKIFCPSHEMYRSKLNEQVTLRHLQTLKACIGWLILPTDNKLTHQLSSRTSKGSEWCSALASFMFIQFSEIRHVFCR